MRARLQWYASNRCSELLVVSMMRSRRAICFGQRGNKSVSNTFGPSAEMAVDVVVVVAITTTTTTKHTHEDITGPASLPSPAAHTDNSTILRGQGLALVNKRRVQRFRDTRLQRFVQGSISVASI